MATSKNRVELIGRLGKDPEIKTLQNGSPVANFSVATSESWKDKKSEKKEKTEWHNVVVWAEKTIEFIEKYLSKGDLVHVEGKMQTRSWEDKDGQKKYATEVVIPAFASPEALMKLSWDKDSSDGDDDRGSSRGSSRTRSRDDDDDDRRDRSRGRPSPPSRSRDDDDDDRGSRGRSRDRDDDRDPPRRATNGKAKNEDLDDDIPF